VVCSHCLAAARPTTTLLPATDTKVHAMTESSLSIGINSGCLTPTLPVTLWTALTLIFILFLFFKGSGS
jgi:hypothetical protein